METIDLNDYVSGGYYIGAYTSRPDNKKSYLPERIVSVSDCRGDLTHVSWLILDDEIYSTHLEKQGLPKDKQDKARNWYKTNWENSISYPDGFYSLQTARQFASNFMVLREEHFIVGIGLHTTFAAGFVKENDALTAQLVSDEKIKKWQLKRDEPCGVNKIIRQHILLESYGKLLGFEPVVYFTDFSCNYLCTCEQFDMIDKFNAYPNSYGLIDSFEIASEVRKWRGSDEDYYPWLIVQYPITEAT